MLTFLLDPSAVKDYQFNWAANTNPLAGPLGPGWLAPNELIVTQTVVASPVGLLIFSVSQFNGVVTYWVSPVGIPQIYTVTCHITTDQGRQDSRSMLLEVAPQ